MFGSTKKKIDPGKSKADYEQVIKRCYDFDRLTLALCSFECFTGFNVERGVSDRRRHYFYRDDFVMKGVVDEHTRFDRHIPCTLKIHDSGTASEDDIGSMMLTHLTRDEREPHEQRELLLEAHVDDTGGQYAAALQQCLRDAAISGQQFMHVRLICSSKNEEEPRTAIDLCVDVAMGRLALLLSFTCGLRSGCQRRQTGRDTENKVKLSPFTILPLSASDERASVWDVMADAAGL